MIVSPCVERDGPGVGLGRATGPPPTAVAAIIGCPVIAGVAGEAGEPLTVQVKVVVPAVEFTVTLPMTKLPS